ALSFGKKPEEVGIVPSMGRTGSALDNAISEIFVASLKCELLHRHRFLSREAAKTAVFDFIEASYNGVRRHSSLGYLSPSEYEQATMEEVAVA
ncbi:MAG TPA: integrase core domain-containing protein, partial [Rubrobacteraceae bacterium]|nr:integrase core domain-containing protein [Rubrobacteraceae bacterium]